MSFFPTKSRALPVAAVLLLAACATPDGQQGAGEEGIVRIAATLQAQGDDAAAANFYQRALDLRPDDLTALKNLAAILEAHGNLEAAESFYRRALNVAPDDREILSDEGRVLIRLGRADEARGLYQKILDQDPRDVKALNDMGVALDYLGRHDDAQKQYQLALDRQPDDLSTLSNLAHSHVLAGQYEAAIALLEPHARDKAATPALRQNLAEAYGMAGMFVDAERMARVDLKLQEVKRNLAYYRARRAKLAPGAEFAADLGSYPTRDMAEAGLQKVEGAVTDKQVTVAIDPEVDSIGGTPHFALRATGFRNPRGLQDFCALLAKNGLACKPAKK
jgi:Flp pilus assembly protein TadD